MSKWKIPKWKDLYEPEYEVPILKELSVVIQNTERSITCEPDFSTEGCAFVSLVRNGIVFGRICVARNESGSPFFSGYFGASEDEFHGFNQDALISLSLIHI